MRCRASWMLQLLVIASNTLPGIYMQQTVVGIQPKEDSTPYRRVSTQCNPQEGDCEQVNPRTGILGYDAAMAAQTIDQLGLNGTEAGQVNSSINLGDVPPKELIGIPQLLSPSSEDIQNPAEEDDSTPPSQEWVVNPMFSLIGDLSLQVSPLPSMLPAMVPTQLSKDVENQKQSPSPSVLPLMSPRISPSPQKSPPAPDSPKQSPSPEKIDSPSPATPGFNVAEQQSKGLIRQNQSEIEGEQACGVTERGCSCEEEWQFNFKTYQGCFNPDNDTNGAWCIVKEASCIEPPGQIQVQGTNQTTGNFFDYCIQDCLITDGKKNDTTAADSSPAIQQKQQVEEEEEVVVEEEEEQEVIQIEQQPEQQQQASTAPSGDIQDPDECIEVVSECKDSQFSIAFADGYYVPSITYQDYSYSLVQGWWNIDQPAEKIRWCSPSKSVALFVQAYGVDQDRKSDVIWSDQFITSRQYCVPNDGQQFSLLQFVSNTDPNQAFYNDAYTNYTSCDQYNGTLKMFFVYQTPIVLTINQCQ